jgi:pyrrolysine biosynthesis protein PylC
MRLLVVGGRLQGTEAVYLAAKAGHETLLIDRRPSPPAAGIAHEHAVMDITADEDRSRRLALSCDAILPALEDEATLAWLEARAPGWGVPLLFDMDAYRLTQSKTASRRLFERLAVSHPKPWPSCGFPAIVKPEAASGSEGVHVVRDEVELTAALAALSAMGHVALTEQYVKGLSLSLEVVSWGGRHVPLQVTALEFDARHDCMRVLAPVNDLAGAGDSLVCRLERIGCVIADELDLHGVMDVEIIVDDEGLPVVLEIDARLPSQTPTAVYWSTGVNIIEALLQAARRGEPAAFAPQCRRACVYQHVRADAGRLEVVGEHALADAGPLRLVQDFFGADEALTDKEAGGAAWVATVIATAATLAEASAKAAAVLEAIAREEGLVLPLQATAFPAEAAFA